MKGKLIALEGVDGSGKATQARILLARLEKAGFKTGYLDFPQYGSSSAFFAEKYLRGEFSKASPQAAAVFFAIDRFASRENLARQLKGGKIVVANRYVSSNLAHQGGRLEGGERDRFFKWASDLEYNVFGLPKPDLTIFLSVPSRIGQGLVGKKRRRSYLKGRKMDMHEKDLGHLGRAEQIYKELAKMEKWATVECWKGRLLAKQEVAELVWKAVTETGLLA